MADYIKDQLNRNRENASNFWRVIKSVFPSKTAKNEKNTTKLQGPNGQILPLEDTPDFINDFFVNEGKVDRVKARTNRTQNKHYHDLNTTIADLMEFKETMKSACTD